MIPSQDQDVEHGPAGEHGDLGARGDTDIVRGQQRRLPGERVRQHDQRAGQLDDAVRLRPHQLSLLQPHDEPRAHRPLRLEMRRTRSSCSDSMLGPREPDDTARPLSSSMKVS